MRRAAPAGAAGAPGATGSGGAVIKVARSVLFFETCRIVDNSTEFEKKSSAGKPLATVATPVTVIRPIHWQTLPAILEWRTDAPCEHTVATSSYDGKSDNSIERNGGS